MARDYALISGGSCEFEKMKRSPAFPGMKIPEFMGSNLGFRPMSRLAKGLVKRGYEINMNYASDKQSKCESTCTSATKCSAKTAIKMNNNSWSKACIKAASSINTNVEDNTIENFVKDIENTAANIKKEGSNSKVLISFITHGMPKGYNSSGAPLSGLKSHGICFNTPDGGYEYIEIDDPRIKKSLDKLKDSGAKIGLIDHSCYGGETTKKLKDYGCILSSQTDQNTSSAGVGLINTLNKKLQGSEPFSLSDAFLENQMNKKFDLIYGSTNYGVMENNLNFATMSGYDDPMRKFLTHLNYVAPNNEIILNKSKNNELYSYTCEDLSREFSFALDELLNSNLAESIEDQAVKTRLTELLGEKPEKLETLLNTLNTDIKRLQELTLKGKSSTEEFNRIENLLYNSEGFDISSAKRGEIYNNIYITKRRPGPRNRRSSKKEAKFTDNDKEEVESFMNMLLEQFDPSDPKLSPIVIANTFNDNVMASFKNGFVGHMKNSSSPNLSKLTKKASSELFEKYMGNIKTQVTQDSNYNKYLELGRDLRKQKSNIENFDENATGLRDKIKTNAKKVRQYALVSSQLSNKLNSECDNFNL
jgi:hypothetical protein